MPTNSYVIATPPIVVSRIESESGIPCVQGVEGVQDNFLKSPEFEEKQGESRMLPENVGSRVQSMLPEHQQQQAITKYDLDSIDTSELKKLLSPRPNKIQNSSDEISKENENLQSNPTPNSNRPSLNSIKKVISDRRISMSNDKDTKSRHSINNSRPSITNSKTSITKIRSSIEASKTSKAESRQKPSSKCPVILCDNGMRVFEPSDQNIDICQIFDEVWEEWEQQQ